MIRHKYSGTVVGRLGWEKAVTLEVRNQSFSQSTFVLSIPLFHLVRFFISSKESDILLQKPVRMHKHYFSFVSITITESCQHKDSNHTIQCDSYSLTEHSEPLCAARLCYGGPGVPEITCWGTQHCSSWANAGWQGPLSNRHHHWRRNGNVYFLFLIWMPCGQMLNYKQNADSRAIVIYGIDTRFATLLSAQRAE